MVKSYPPRILCCAGFATFSKLTVQDAQPVSNHVATFALLNLYLTKSLPSLGLNVFTMRALPPDPRRTADTLKEGDAHPAGVPWPEG